MPAHLMNQRNAHLKPPLYPVTPIYLYGIGKALPKGEGLFVPFNVEVSVGESVGEEVMMEGNATEACALLERRFFELKSLCRM